MKTKKLPRLSIQPWLMCCHFCCSSCSHLSTPPASSLQRKTVLRTLPLPPCSFHLSCGGKADRCWFLPSWEHNAWISVCVHQRLPERFAAKQTPEPHFAEMDLQGIEWTWEACICTNAPVALMQVVNEFENHCPKSLSLRWRDVAASTFALGNTKSRNSCTSQLLKQKNPQTLKSSKTEWKYEND